jgi:hypothetical protein
VTVDDHAENVHFTIEDKYCAVFPYRGFPQGSWCRGAQWFGKSTLLKNICRIWSWAGTVRINGRTAAISA